MPRLTIFYIRISLFYLLTSSLIGILFLLSREYSSLLFFLKWKNVHLIWILFGWLLQFAIGTAWWIFPRLFTENKYGNLKLGWLGFLLINTALLLQIIHPYFPIVMKLGFVMIFIGLAIQAFSLWRRVLTYN